MEQKIDYKLILDNFLDHILILDTDLKITYANYPSPGLTLDDIIGKPIYSFVEPSRQEEIVNILKGVFESGKNNSYETEFKLPDGNPIYYESRVIPLKDVNGETTAVILTARDITLRKTVEISQTLLQNSPNYFILVDFDMKIRFSNTVGHETPIDFRFGESLEDYFKTSKEFKELFNRSIENNQKMECELRSKQGTFFHTFIIPYYDGEKNEILLILNDITSFKQSNEKIKKGQELFRKAILGSPIPTMLHREDGKVLFINEIWSKITGYSHEEIPTISDWIRKAYPQAEEKIREGISNLFYLNDIIDEGEFQITTKSGEIRYWNFFSAPLGVIEGLKLVKSVALDITNQKINEMKIREAEEEKSILQSQIQQNQKLDSLGLLAGGIAHDFNNFLMGIFGNISLLQEEITPSNPAYSILEDLNKITFQAKELTNQILTFTGKSNVETQNLRIDQYIKEIERIIKVSAAKNKEVVFEYPETMKYINISPIQLQQTIINLILNASEAIDAREDKSQGRIELIVGSENISHEDFLEPNQYGSKREGEYGFIKIKDNGVGIDKNTIKKIFDPFFTTKSSGKGLGLSVVYGIVNTNHGFLKINSALSEGTEITFGFPIVETLKSDNPKVDKFSNQIRRKHTMLIIEDEPYIRDVLSKMIIKLGSEVVIANNGVEGIEKLASNPNINIIILDMTMPVMSGLETFTKIREINPIIPIIISSGYNNEEFHNDIIIDNEITGYLQKPYTLNNLKDCLAYFL